MWYQSSSFPFRLVTYEEGLLPIVVVRRLDYVIVIKTKNNNPQYLL